MLDKKIILSGYFGYDNLGDEAILYSMIEGLKTLENVELVALSANPEKTTQKFGIRAAERMKVGTLLKEIKNCDLFISGGGSLFQDVTSKRSIYYYLGLLFLAKKIFKKKVMIYSQGIGPVLDSSNRKKMKAMFNDLDCINVRDKESKKELLDMGVNREISVTADTVFMLPSADSQWGHALFEKMGVDVQEKTVGISIRPWKDLDKTIVEEIKNTIEHLQDTGVNIVLLPFHHPGDLTLSKMVYNSLNDKKNVFLIEESLNEREMLSVIANIDIMLSMRLHGLIFGVVGGAYPIGISYDPKINSLMKELQFQEPISVEQLDSGELITQLEDSLADLEKRKEQTKKAANTMREKALKNIELVKELLN